MNSSAKKKKSVRGSENHLKSNVHKNVSKDIVWPAGTWRGRYTEPHFARESPRSPQSPQGVPKEFPRSPQGVPKESLWSSPSITLVLPDSKDSPRTPQGLPKDSLRTPCIILIKRGLFRESLYSPTGTDQGLCKDSIIILIYKE